MKGTLYGVGIGPGDPELVTIKAKRILETVDVVAVPESGKGKGSLSLSIVKDYLKMDIEIITLTFPMIADESVKQRYREDNSRVIMEKIDAGRHVAFLTLGDPMLYSTYIYLLECLKKYDINIETIPGVTSFCAISSKLNMPLAKHNETLCIIPLHEQTDIDGLIESMDNLVFLKVSSNNERLARSLDRSREKIDMVVASKLGSLEERISYDPAQLSGDIPYLTTVIVKNH